MPDFLARIAPPGTSPTKLVLAAVLVLGALGVLAWDVVYMTADPPSYPDAEALEPGQAAAAGWTSAAAAAEAGPATFEPALTAASGTGADRAGTAPVGAPAADAIGPPVAANGSSPQGASPGARPGEPDWGALFQQMLARADAAAKVAEETDGSVTRAEIEAQLARFRVHGILADSEGGLALVDGRFLRVGDELPGTRLHVHEIRRDRLLVSSPGRTEAFPLLLDPLGAGTDVP